MTYFTKTDIIAFSMENLTFQKEINDVMSAVNSTTAGTPGSFSKNIAGTGETAYQRAIIDKQKTNFNEFKIDWIDIETPVIPGGSSRRNCLDLIGIAEENNKVVLVELKDEGGDNPFDAAFQIIEYFLDIVKNSTELKLHKNIGKSYSTIADIYQNKKPDKKNTVLIVAGPVNYWKEWEDSINLSALLKEFKKIIEKDYTLHFAKFPTEKFSDQKLNENKYTPELKNNPNLKWEEL